MSKVFLNSVQVPWHFAIVLTNPVSENLRTIPKLTEHHGGFFEMTDQLIYLDLGSDVIDNYFVNYKFIYLMYSLREKT